VVEGSRLFEADLPAPGGAAEWEYFFPIRGAYRLEVSAFGKNGEQLQKIFNLPIRENPLRLFYLGSFIVVVLVVGFVAGRSLNHAARRFQSL
jgi:hypothetical protein